MVSRSLDAVTGLAVRPESGQPHLAGEARVAQRIAEPDDLVIEGRGPDVRVVDEPRRQVLGERLERVRRRSGPDAGDPLPVDVGPDRLAVPAEVPGDRRDRPAPASQCMCFHVFPMCEHAERVSLRAGWLGRSSASKGAHRRGWMVQLTGTGWGISVIEGGEIQKSRTAEPGSPRGSSGHRRHLASSPRGSPHGSCDQGTTAVFQLSGSDGAVSAQDPRTSQGSGWRHPTSHTTGRTAPPSGPRG